MRIPKRYGQSKVYTCPFCGKNAVTENPQGVPVCAAHKPDELNGLKCLCGDWLELRKGKWGPYGSCLRCGNLNFRKVLEINPDAGRISKEAPKTSYASKPKQYPAKPSPKQYLAKPNYKAEKEAKKEIVIRSDELDFYFG